MTKHSPGDGPNTILATYLGGTAIACGTAVSAVTVPTGATSASVRAEGANCYYSVNSIAGTATSPGYVPQDWVSFIPPIDNFNSLSVVGASSSAILHVEFYIDF